MFTRGKFRWEGIVKESSPLGLLYSYPHFTDGESEVQRGTQLVNGRINMYTLLYFKWITSKDFLYSIRNSAQCYVAAWIGGEFGEAWIHVYVWLNPLTILQYKIKH